MALAFKQARVFLLKTAEGKIRLAKIGGGAGI
jgi:hypothetical protein